MAEHVKRLFRAEMTRRGVTYEELSERLAAIGVNDTPVNLRNKVARAILPDLFGSMSHGARSAAGSDWRPKMLTGNRVTD